MIRQIKNMNVKSGFHIFLACHWIKVMTSRDAINVIKWRDKLNNTKKKGKIMSNKEMIKTLRSAAKTQENIVLKMLLIYAAERIENLDIIINQKKGEKE